MLLEGVNNMMKFSPAPDGRTLCRRSTRLPHRLQVQRRPALVAVALAMIFVTASVPTAVAVNASYQRPSRIGVFVSSQAMSAATKVAVPDQCETEPRPEQDFTDLSAAPPGLLQSAVLGSPIAQMPPAVVDYRASSSEITGIAEVVAEFAACSNAGEFRRATALFSDRFFVRSFGGLDVETLDRLFLGGSGPADSRVTEVEVEDVGYLSDGRISAVTRMGQATNQMTFIEQDGQYLIDDSIELTEIATPEPTP